LSGQMDRGVGASLGYQLACAGTAARSVGGGES